MSETLKLYELPPSPNNMKVRIALNYKQLPFEARTLPMDQYPGDRSELVRLSRQPRTPVLQHGDRVIFDSGAILRYLEANFPDGPTLFSDDFTTFGQIEEWEWMARIKLLKPVRMILGQALSEQRDPEVIRRANSLLHEHTERVEHQLARTSFLVGERMTAADVTAAPPIHYAMLPDGAEADPLAAFFRQNFRLGEGRDRTRAWVRRVMEYHR